MDANRTLTMDKKFLQESDREYLASKGYEYKEHYDGVRNGLIIENFTIIPAGKFNLPLARLLIIVPRGYPDVAPDMFYFSPALLLVSSGSYPSAADVFESYFGANWQRWSRHSTPDAWRAGIDGIGSYIQRVITALKVA